MPFVGQDSPTAADLSGTAEGYWGVRIVKEREDVERLLTPAEVAARFRVDPKTVTRWAKAGKLSSIRTLGGHRRYRAREIEALLGGSMDGAPVR
jgi:excisionase family DNA binding protein